MFGDPEISGDPELFANFESTADTGVPYNKQMLDTADLLTAAGPGAPNDTESTDNSVSQTADDNLVGQTTNEELVGQTVVLYTMVHKQVSLL